MERRGETVMASGLNEGFPFGPGFSGFNGESQLAKPGVELAGGDGVKMERATQRGKARNKVNRQLNRADSCGKEQFNL